MNEFVKQHNNIYNKRAVEIVYNATCARYFSKCSEDRKKDRKPWGKQ